MVNSDKSWTPISIALFSSNCGTFVTFPRFNILILTFMSAVWKNWAVGNRILLKIFELLARFVIEFVKGLVDCLIISPTNSEKEKAGHDGAILV